jgi:hypothetical protein
MTYLLVLIIWQTCLASGASCSWSYLYTWRNQNDLKSAYNPQPQPSVVSADEHVPYCILRADLIYSPPSMVLMMMWTSSALSSISGISLACPSMSHPVQISGKCVCVCSLVSVRVCSGHRSAKHLRKSISYSSAQSTFIGMSVRKWPVKFSNMLIIPFLEKMLCFVGGSTGSWGGLSCSSSVCWSGGDTVNLVQDMRGFRTTGELNENNVGKGICDWVSASHQAAGHFHREHSSVWEAPLVTWKIVVTVISNMVFSCSA